METIYYPSHHNIHPAFHTSFISYILYFNVSCDHVNALTTKRLLLYSFTIISFLFSCVRSFCGGGEHDKMRHKHNINRRSKEGRESVWYLACNFLLLFKKKICWLFVTGAGRVRRWREIYKEMGTWGLERGLLYKYESIFLFFKCSLNTESTKENCKIKSCVENKPKCTTKRRNRMERWAH